MMLQLHYAIILLCAALVKTQLGRAINILDVFKLQLSQGFIC